ncbi:hypothetical protein POVCU2_0027830 [Plasmodium ovale curtisi]|uniref:PIR Superfamily Protein n=1 Tax=Plasmodium ovale curtisi TaxID=864141 RepID=A0A1A8XDD4_PLAOA|nr:hypothetical protein POVCU2_0027830 [Plasmodium ovale curtisi]SBT02325.1 hypothetical protein POVCU1_075570 [Plasmodium ovale curtisi]
MESPETHTSRDPVITGENTECSKKPLAEGPSEKCNQADSLEGTVRETCDTVNSVNNLCATLLSNSNTPDTYRYPQGILRKNGIYIPLSTKDTPYILQNGILRIPSPIDYSFLKKIFKRKKGKSSIRRKNKNEITAYDSEDLHIISYNRPLHLGYYPV